MYGMVTLSPTRSSFSISTKPGSSLAEGSPNIRRQAHDVTEAYITEHPDSFDITLLAPPPEDIKETTCAECSALVSRVSHTWFTDPTAQRELQVAVLHHFRYHNSLTHMNDNTSYMGELMERTALRGAQPSTLEDQVSIENDKLDAFFDFGEDTAKNHDAEEEKADDKSKNNIGVVVQNSQPGCSSLTELSDISALNPDIATTGPPKQSRKAWAVKGRFQTSSRKLANASARNHTIPIQGQTARNKSVIKWLVGVQEALQDRNEM
jgi:hypothetical protein